MTAFSRAPVAAVLPAHFFLASSPLLTAATTTSASLRSHRNFRRDNKVVRGIEFEVRANDFNSVQLQSVMAQSHNVFGLLLLSSLALANRGFSYDGVDGPSHWAEKYNECVGKHQSPINIEEHIVENVNLPPLRFFGLDVARSAYLTNNGHTVMLMMNDSDTVGVTGGPLGDANYVFEQLHFHWGENDREGSEDLINNHSFAMELHIVLYKQDYGSMAKATEFSDGLVVLAYFFEACEEDNPTYNSIVETLPEIEEEDSKTMLNESLVVDPIFVPQIATMHNYFTYNGSLTTPPCSEVVTWIDFKDPLPLSHRQIAAFRDVRSAEGHKLTHNFRPVQPLEDRVVYHNIGHGPETRSADVNKSTGSNEIGGSHSGQSASATSTTAFFLSCLLVVDLAIPLVTPFFEDAR